jgi:hypothetical protein
VSVSDQSNSTDRIFHWVEELAAHDSRLPDTPGALAAVRLIAEEFRGLGLTEVSVEETQTVRWDARSWGLRVDSVDILCSPVYHSFTDGSPAAFSTGAGGLRAPLVDLGRGTEADFARAPVAGKIVLCDWEFERLSLNDEVLYHHDPGGAHGGDTYLNPYSPRETFPMNLRRAQEAGAVGFVGVLRDYYRDRHCFANEAYHVYEGNPFRIPGLWVSSSTGASLRQLVDSRDELAVSLLLEGELAPATSRTVVGSLPGAGPKADEVVIVESHYDSVFAGAVQDATGTAAVLELAGRLSAVPAAERDRSIRFILFDGHFGDYAAQRRYIERHSLADVAMAVSVEHIGLELVDEDAGPRLTGRPAYRIIWTSPSEGVVSAVTDAVRRHNLGGVAVMSSDHDPIELGADADLLWQEGIPVVSLLGVPTYMYDEIDTLDKVARDQLEPTVAAFFDIVRALDTLPRVALGTGRARPLTASLQGRPAQGELQ